MRRSRKPKHKPPPGRSMGEHTFRPGLTRLIRLHMVRNPPKNVPGGRKWVMLMSIPSSLRNFPAPATACRNTTVTRTPQSGYRRNQPLFWVFIPQNIPPVEPVRH
jgi:hypothetical protein